MARRRAPKPKTLPDYVFIGMIGILVMFGLVMLASASSDLAKVQFGNSYFYLKHQVTYGLLLGLAGFIVGAFVYYQKWRKFAIALLLLNIVALLLVFTPIGLEIKGAARWLNIGGTSVQPGELLKLTFIIYLASWLSRSKSRSKSISEGLLPFLVLVGAVTILLFLQPSTTTAIIIFTAAVIIYFSSGARVSFLAAIMLIGILILSVLIYVTPYRMQRILTFLNPEIDTLGSSYHINQSLIAIGSGGLTGVGYGKSTTKLNYLPEPTGDSIFAVIAEELGFIGAGALLLVFLIFTLRGIAIARAAPDSFGRLLVVGFVSLITIQTIVNVAAISGLLPLTGVPLPFISYGGTALATFMTMGGIVVNVSRYRTP